MSNSIDELIKNISNDFRNFNKLTLDEQNDLNIVKNLVKNIPKFYNYLVINKNVLSNSIEVKESLLENDPKQINFLVRGVSRIQGKRLINVVKKSFKYKTHKEKIDFYKKIIIEKPELFKYLEDDVRKEPLIESIAVKSFNKNIKYIDDKLKYKSILLHVAVSGDIHINELIEYMTDKEFVIDLYNNSMFYYMIYDKLPENLKKDEDIICLEIKKSYNQEGLKILKEGVEITDNLIMKLIDIGKFITSYIALSDLVINNEEYVRAICEKNIYVYLWEDLDRYNNNIDFVKFLVNCNTNYFKYIPENMMEDKDILDKIVKTNIKDVSYLNKFISDETQLYILKKDISAYLHLKKKDMSKEVMYELEEDFKSKGLYLLIKEEILRYKREDELNDILNNKTNPVIKNKKKI